MIFTPVYPPYAHQSQARSAARTPDGGYKSGYALLMEMGTGKTKTDIDETCEMFCEGLIDCYWVVSPKGVMMNWVNRELPTHLPDEILKSVTIVEWRAGGGNKAHQKRLAALLDPTDDLRILVMNVEALSTGDKAYSYAERFIKSARRGCKGTVDESTTIKNHSANRTESVVKLGELCSVRRIMTGSPVTKSPLDLFGQLRFLMRNPLGFSSFYSFRARYAVMQKKSFGGRSVNIVVGYRDVEDLNKKIAPYSFRVKKEGCLDLPPKVYEQREVELTPEQRRIYDSMLETATAALDGEAHVTATEVITQILRLHQVVCGHVVDELGITHEVPTNRVQALLDIVEETSGKIIIWSRYRHDIENICRALRKEYGDASTVEYHGGVSVKEREVNVSRFQGTVDTPHDPECRFMVSNPQVGGFGVTWVVANTVIYYSNSYDLELRVQSEDRAHRVGQTKSVTYVDLVAPGTVDEKILKALRNKINIASAVLGDGYREWLL